MKKCPKCGDSFYYEADLCIMCEKAGSALDAKVKKGAFDKTKKRFSSFLQDMKKTRKRPALNITKNKVEDTKKRPALEDEVFATRKTKKRGAFTTAASRFTDHSLGKETNLERGKTKKRAIFETFFSSFARSDKGETEYTNKDHQTAKTIPKEEGQYYLISPALPLTTLRKDKTLHIGRNPDNDLVLSSQEISRYHCLVRWSETGFMIIDKKSANGVLVNDQLVAAHLLCQRDRIRIGPVILEYKEILVAEDSTDTGEETIRIRKSSVKKNIRQSAQRLFSGDMKTFPLYQVLQMLAAEAKSGEIRIFDDCGRVGSIYLQFGFVVHSIHELTTGHEAFYLLGQMMEGRYEYDPTVTPPEKTMNSAVEGLLMECARRIDEANNSVGA